MYSQLQSIDLPLSNDVDGTVGSGSIGRMGAAGSEAPARVYACDDACAEAIRRSPERYITTAIGAPHAHRLVRVRLVPVPAAAASPPSILTRVWRRLKIVGTAILEESAFGMCVLPVIMELTTWVAGFPVFVMVSTISTWILSAFAVGSSLRIGRAILRAVCVPAALQHDPIALALGLYVFMFVCDLSIIVYYAHMSAAAGLVRRYAMAVGRTASLVEEGWAASSPHEQAVDANAVIANAQAGMSVEALVPASIVSRSVGSSSSRTNGKARVSVFDLSTTAAAASATPWSPSSPPSLVSRIGTRLLKSALWYIGIPILRHASRIALDIGNTHQLPREMTLRRALAGVKTAAAMLVFAPALLGLAWSSVADPIGMTAAAYALKRAFLAMLSPSAALLLTDAVSAIGLDQVLLPAQSSLSWSGSSPLSSLSPASPHEVASTLLSLWVFGCLVLTVVMEVAYQGLLGESAYDFVELLEWRCISAQCSRIWHFQVKPKVKLLALVAVGCCIVAIQAVTAMSAVGRWVDSSAATAEVEQATPPQQQRTLQAQSAARCAVTAFLITLVCVNAYRNRHKSGIVPRLRRQLEVWREELRKQRYQIGMALQNFPESLRKTTSGTNTRKSS